MPFVPFYEQIKASLLSLLSPHFKQSLDIIFEQHITSHQTQLVGQSLRGIKHVIAIGSGKGGVGKSTITANLAVALSKLGAKVGVLDADIYGPSIPMLFGLPRDLTLSTEDSAPPFSHGVYTMSMGYLSNQDYALIWRGPMLAKALIQLINLSKWDSLDYLLIDLPPGTGDIQLTLVQKIPLTGAVIVTTPQQLATLDAKKAIHMFEKTHIRCLGLIENMALHTCRHCHHTEAIFGEGGATVLANQHHIPFLGQLPLKQSIQINSDSGTPLNQDDETQATFMKMALELSYQIASIPVIIGNARN
jgi:ATP-binding protein involved in chromosome partitioning